MTTYDSKHGIIAAAQAPPCHRCGGQTSIQKIGDSLYFVVCAGAACTTRAGAEGQTGPAALSNGKESQHLAEEDWRKEVQAKVTARVPGYRMT